MSGMKQPTLYLFIGYPGAGKTTVAKIITEATGAEHLWADFERHKLFKRPTHSQAESLRLYERLNRQAEALLAAGRSVVFDTNFNFYADRQKLREIARRGGAATQLIWISVPKEFAKSHVVDSSGSRNGYQDSMSEAQFEAITGKLEPPAEDEKFIKIDGTKLDRETVLALLS
jgi:predicted kinase